MVNKKEERQRLHSQIKTLSNEYRQQAEREINQKLIKLLRQQKPQAVAIYLNKETEVATDFIQQWLLKHDWKVYAPQVSGSDLKFYPLPQDRSEWVWKEYFKIWEPPRKGEPITEFDIMIVPVVGYNHKGYRLGHGQGYYDRWLQRYRPKLTIGLAYAEQAADSHLIFSNFDVPLDLVITNKKGKND